MTVTYLHNWPISNIKIAADSLYATSCILQYRSLLYMCHRLRDDHVWTSQCIRFVCLILKMKIKEVDDFVKNWQASLLCRNACVLKLALLCPTVCCWCNSWRTYVRMYGLKRAMTLHRSTHLERCNYKRSLQHKYE